MLFRSVQLVNAATFAMGFQLHEGGLKVHGCRRWSGTTGATGLKCVLAYATVAAGTRCIGAPGLQFLQATGQTAAADPVALRVTTAAAHSALRTGFGAADDCKAAIFMTRWINTAGDKGRWSEVGVATVAR